MIESFDLEQVTVRDLKFMLRRGTSDIKAVKEVVGKLSYRKKDFELEAQRWIDLGANIGAFTCLVASRGVPVVAYEPDPGCFAMLEQNVRLNGLRNVEIINAAVVDGPPGEVVLHLNSASGNYWRNSIVKRWRGGVSIAVPSVSVASLPSDVDCKMDVEGAEMQILEAKDLPRWRRLVFEWSFDVDPSIPRFQRAVARLRERYTGVRYGKFDESVPEWGKSWFPPCRTVWCQEKK